MLTHYQTLNVSLSADIGAIKKAYHKISLLHHPDKMVHLPDAERARREQLFKFANVAFEVLSDPQKRKTYDQNLRTGQSRSTTHDRNTAARNTTTHPPYGLAPDAQPPNGGGEPTRSPPPRSPTANPGGTQGFQGSQGIQRAPSSTHRFTASTLGKAPDFHWYHCQLNEYSKHTTLTYNNWLGWNFAIIVANHFKVIAKPVIPQKPVSESIIIRLPLLRKPKEEPHSPNNVVIDLRGAPGNKHTILCPALVESQAAGLELVVELAIAPESAQRIAQGSVAWKWAYVIDHEPLAAGMIAKVTNILFYPYKPFMAISPRERMPAPPYTDESPMRGLLAQFPGMKIGEPAPDTYCVKEEQQGKVMWRLTAVGSM